MLKRHLQQIRYPNMGLFPEMQNLQPHPFPGLRPTRVAWWISGEGGYLGKPCPERVQEFRTKLRGLEPWITAWIIEFDQTHPCIYSWHSQRGVVSHSTLYGLYHYWHTLTNEGAHLTLPNYPKQLAGLVVYSPYRTLSQARKDDFQRYALLVTTPAPPKLSWNGSISSGGAF